MSAKHTAGPWFAEAGNHNRFSVFNSDSQTLARLYDRRGSFPQAQMDGHQYLYDGQAEANARLIAAAPDLLEALQLMIADFADYPASERPCLAFDKANAAIAKATAA